MRADSVCSRAARPALTDVTSASVNILNDAGGAVKRQRTAEDVQDVGVT